VGITKAAFGLSLDRHPDGQPLFSSFFDIGWNGRQGLADFPTYTE
jgi:hypothetical protein